VPSTESVTQVSPQQRISAIPASWKRLSQAAFLFVAAATSPCFPLPPRSRFGFSPDPTSTVLVFTALPARRRITLAEARRRALAAMDLAEERRHRLRDEEARRWQLLDAVS
jgi:hypothetical protein